MAPTNATSSPRDNHVDANPELARKKQRLDDNQQQDDDADNSDRLSEESVIVEVLEPEDVGTSLETAIAIEDDNIDNMKPYSHDFLVRGDLDSPIAQIKAIHTEITTGRLFLPLDTFQFLAVWVRHHCDTTRNDSHAEWRRQYMDTDSSFFSHLGHFVLTMMTTHDLLDPCPELDSTEMKRAMISFFTGFSELSCRIITLLPEAIKMTISRRDSAAQDSTRSQTVDLLQYVGVALRTLGKHSSMAATYRKQTRVDMRAMFENTTMQLADVNILESLVAIANILGGAMRQVNHSWDVVHDIFRIMHSVVTSHPFERLPTAQLLGMMKIINTSILPTICAKHPGALPVGFHGDITSIGQLVLHMLVQMNDDDDVHVEIYRSLVKSEEDSILVENVGDQDLSLSLDAVCGQDQEALAEMLSSSWGMQAANSFIRSDIMDIRSLGLVVLSQILEKIYKAAIKHEDRFDHVLVQYAVRFLRKNEVTKYIFSSDSHASLIVASISVIRFLAVTLTYTNLETDVIWQACTTSVEADFVKASFKILDSQLEDLDFSHLIFILRKYEETPVQKIDGDAIQFLHRVLRSIERFTGAGADSANRIQLAFTTIDILSHLEHAAPCSSSGELQSALVTEIARFAGDDFTIHDRREVYAKYLPDIEKQTPGASVAVQALAVMLNVGLTPEDYQTILLILPVRAAVEELRHFVATSKNDALNAFTIHFVNIRLTSIVRLMSVESGSPNDDVAKVIFDCVFGEDALSEAARGQAWDQLSALTRSNDHPHAAVGLWTNYMQRYVPTLPTALVSPKLVELIWTYLRNELATDPFRSDLSLLLDHPLWMALGRFALTSDNDDLSLQATAVVRDLLFDYPMVRVRGIPRDTIVKCQRQFIRSHIEAMHKGFGHLLGNADEKRERALVRAIYTLEIIRRASRDTSAYYTMTTEPDTLLIDAADTAADHLSFTVQVYSAAPQPKTIAIQASKTATISQLLDKLSTKTGSSSNRVIAGGREVTGDTTRSLADLGLQNSGVIHVRPRYTQEFDFDQLSSNAGPAEQEIVAHYNALETLLDGPPGVASQVCTDFTNLVNELTHRQTLDLLYELRPTAQARDRVTSSAASVSELFPQDKPERARYSTHVLSCHLRDCASMGLADADFLVRGVRLLTAVVMDDARHVVNEVTEDIVRCLKAFLQGKQGERTCSVEPEITSHAERPSTEEPLQYFEDGAAFADKVTTMLSAVQRVPISQSPLRNDGVLQRTALIGDIYTMFLLAGRVDDGVWQRFSSSDELAKLHAELLLDADGTFCARVADPIRSLCQDLSTPSDVPDFFWRIIIAGLSDALQTDAAPATFFRLASEVLHTTNSVRKDESSMRTLVEQLIAGLWAYKHTEFTDDQHQDIAMTGLLALLREAVMILKSFKKPLQLDDFASRVFRVLLFARDDQSPPLTHQATRKVAYELVRLTLESSADVDDIVSSTVHAMQTSQRQANCKYPGSQTWLRAPGDCAGLQNLGMTCYMNSMLQQLFGNVQFRSFIFNLPVMYPEKQHFLVQIQRLFARMQNSLEIYQETQSLAEALGIAVGNQEDVHDFYASFLSRLEDEMPDTDSKTRLTKFFTGQSITQIRGDCGHVSSQKEAFSDLQVTVKNKATLEDSLAEFVQGEPMAGANKYKCLSCDTENGRLVDAMRRTCLDDVPDCLTVCLKRFTYENKVFGEGKVNDRFEFPETVDMSRYKRSHLEDPNQPHESDEFQLVGVIVHQGSLNFGHYWSWVRHPTPGAPGAGQWMYLEDTKALRCLAGAPHVQQECFGGGLYTNGNERQDNAYVLFYQRKQYVAEASIVSENVGGRGLHPGQPPVLPKVPLHSALADDISGQNVWRLKIAALFDDQFGAFMTWLLNQYAQKAKPKSPSPDSESGTESGTDPMQQASEIENAAEDQLARAVVDYVLRILLSIPSPEERLPQTITALEAVISAIPKVSLGILRYFSTDSFGFEAILLDGSHKVRFALLTFLHKCAETLRDYDPPAYLDMVRRMVTMHARLLSAENFLDRNFALWTDYFALPGWLATQGPEEAGLVLEAGYLEWVIEVVFMPYEQAFRPKHQCLWNYMSRNSGGVDYDPLFIFLHNLLKDHIDLEDLDYQQGPRDGLRPRSSRGWRLSQHEVNCLLFRRPTQGKHVWVMFEIALAHTFSNHQMWKDNGMGRLIGLLISEKANPAFRQCIEPTLLEKFDREERHLAPMLHATLHYCLNTDDKDCGLVLRVLAKNLVMWSAQERRCLAFLRDAFVLAPRSTVATVPEWVNQFLVGAKSGLGRQAAATWLKEHIFDRKPITDDKHFDAVRAHVTRLLVTLVSEQVKSAYDRERAKNGYEAAFSTLIDAEEYLSTLKKAVAAAHEEGVVVAQEVKLEADECRPVLERLTELLRTLQYWESEPTSLPTRTTGNVRQSVEIDTDMELSDDEDEFDPDEEDLSQSM